MNEEIIEFMSNIDSNSFEDFINNSNIDTEVALNTELCNYDFSWLDEIEEKLPFISNIINLDYTNGKSKVILKSYENRFVKTVLYRLYDFLLNEKKKVSSIDDNSKNKVIKSNIKSLINNENIEINLQIKTKSQGINNDGEAFGLSFNERIERVFDLTTVLINSDFIKGLEDASLIQTTVEKTEVFNQELNYKKSYELYEFLNNYIEKSEYKDIDYVKKCVNSKLLVTSYLEYQVLNNCMKDNNISNVYKDLLEKIVEKLVSETNIDEKSFKKMISKKFESEYEKKKNREKNIQSIFIKTQDNYNKQIKDALRTLKN